MDKYEYRVRAEEIKVLISSGKYGEAVKIADTIDWRRVKSTTMLCTISDLYKVNRRFEESKEILLLAYERYPSSRAIVYSLCELSIKMGEFVQAVEYYKEFVRIAPRDTGRYILQYRLYEAQDVSLEERIAVLEEFKKHDYREKWAYELAYLYHRVGLTTECIEEVDEMFLWFGVGKFVMKALELKALHEPLSQEQQARYQAYKNGLDGSIDREAILKKDEDPIGNDVSETKQPTKPFYNSPEEREAVEKAALDAGMPSRQQMQMYYGRQGATDNAKKMQDQYASPLDARNPSVADLYPSYSDKPDLENTNPGYYSQEDLSKMNSGYYNQQDLYNTNPGYNDQQDLYNTNPGYNGQEDLYNTNPGYYGQEDLYNTNPGYYGQSGSYNTNPGSYGQEDLHNTNPGYYAQHSLDNTDPGYFGQAPSKGTASYEDPVDQYTKAMPSREQISSYQRAPRMAEPAPVNAPRNIESSNPKTPPKPVGYDTVNLQKAIAESMEQIMAEEERNKPVKAVSEVFYEDATREVVTQETATWTRTDAPVNQKEEPGVTIRPTRKVATSHYDDILKQDYDGQISMVVPETDTVEDQITGQISIDDIMNRIKQQQRQRQEEEVAKRVQDKISTVISQYDEDVKYDLQKEMEKEVKRELMGGNRPKPEKNAGRALLSHAGNVIKPSTEPFVKAGAEGIKRANEEMLMDEDDVMDFDKLEDDDSKEADSSVEASASDKALSDEDNKGSDDAAKFESSNKSDILDEAEDKQEALNNDIKEIVADTDSSDETSDINEFDLELGQEEPDEEDDESEEDIDTEEPDVEDDKFEEADAEESDEEDADSVEDDTEDSDSEEANTVDSDTEASDQETSDKEETSKEDAFKDGTDLPLENLKSAKRKITIVEKDESSALEIPEYTEEVVEMSLGETFNYDETDNSEDESKEDPGEDSYKASSEESSKGTETSSEESSKNTEAPSEDVRESVPETESDNTKVNNAQDAGPSEGEAETESEAKELDTRVRVMTPEEKELFGPYIHHRKSRKQIIRAIDSLNMSPATNNAIVTGEEGTGTINLAKGLIKSVQASGSGFSGKVAKITAQALNRKNVSTVIEKLDSGALIIQRAADMKTDTVESLYKELTADKHGIIIVMEDNHKDMDRLLKRHPELSGCFNVRVDVEALDNESLVAYAKQYALEREYKIDNFGMLSLHSRIEEMQTIDHDVTISEVRDIVDEAIRSAEKKTISHFFDVVLNKRYDEEDMIILTEKDFEKVDHK